MSYLEAFSVSFLNSPVFLSIISFTDFYHEGCPFFCVDFKKLVSIHIVLIERKLLIFAQIASTYEPDKNSGITLSGL